MLLVSDVVIRLVDALQIQVEGDKITDVKFKTFGCGSAIAAR